MRAAVTNLVWRGDETVAAVTAALEDAADVELQLPANFHHAVVARFREARAAPTVETIDVTGGAELLAHLGDIRGLEQVAALVDAVQRLHAEVRVVSPAPTVAIHRHGVVERVE